MSNPFEKGLKRGKKPLPEDKKHRSTRAERGDDSKDKDIEMVSLSGYGVTRNGQITRRNYFTFLEDYVNDNNDMILPKDQALKLQKYMLGLSTGTAAVAPLICAGPRCPYSETCVFMREDNDLDPPLGRNCPIESELMKQRKMAYVDEYNVSVNSLTELAMIDELVRLDILEMRITAQLGKERDATTVSDEVMGADSEGNIIMTRRISPYLESLEKISNMKYRIIRRMVGDRETKYKKAAALKQNEDGTRADDWTKLAEVVEKMKQTALKKASDKAKPVVVDIKDE